MRKYNGVLPLSLVFIVALWNSGCTADRSAVTGAAVPHGKDPLPLFVPGSRILFTGDSITDGNRDKNVRDLNHILGHGYQAEIAARFGADLYDRNLAFFNRGVSGDTVAGLQRRIQRDLIDLKPDVLSILIGVNDLGGRAGGTPEQWADSARQWEVSYDTFLADVTKALPDVRLILAEPFGLPVGAKKGIWETYHPQLELRRAAVARLAVKYHAALVHYQKMFDDAAKKAPPEYWIWDGVHPTIAGHQLMADEWVRVTREFWPAGSVAPLPPRPAVNTPAPAGTGLPATATAPATTQAR